jgi:hypothetical protein
MQSELATKEFYKWLNQVEEKLNYTISNSGRQSEYSNAKFELEVISAVKEKFEQLTENS